jgi:hypothetical protein
MDADDFTAASDTDRFCLVDQEFFQLDVGVAFGAMEGDGVNVVCLFLDVGIVVCHREYLGVSDKKGG